MKLLPHTLRWRLQAWYGLLLLIVLCAFGFTAHHLERIERLHNVDNELQHRLSAVVSELRSGPQRQGQRPEQRPDQRKDGVPPRPSPPQARPSEPGSPPPGPNLVFAPEVQALFEEGSRFYYVVWMRGEEPIARSANAPQDVPRPAPTDAAIRERSGHLRETFLFAAPVDCVLVGRSIADEEGAMRSNATLLTAIGGGLFLLSLIGGGWLIARSIRPIAAISNTAARIADGDLSQRIFNADNQSELGQLSTVLNQTFGRLDEAFAQQTRFTSDAAHELRTPVTILLMQTQGALARERSATEYRAALVSNQSTAQRMRRLIESLLELARFDSKQEPLRREPCDLAVIARDSMEHLQPLADARRITLHADLSDAWCGADSGRIAQVITNLLTNAIEYNHDGGEVRITTRPDNGDAVLVVADNGPGIAAEDLPHIFERFYRADKSRSGAAPRTGLGLAISRALIEAHGGSIEGASTPGEGAVFTVRLPAAKS